MFIYFFAFSAIIMLSYMWKNKHFFSKNYFKDYSDNHVPLVKNGFYFALLGPEEYFKKQRMYAEKFKRSVRGLLFNIEALLIYRAKDAEMILSSSTKHLMKGQVYNCFHPFVKTGLGTSDGEKWRTRRRLLTPAFHSNVLKEYCKVFKEESDQLVEMLKQTNGKVIDIIPISTQFSLNIVCDSTMGIKLSDLGNDGKNYRNNIYDIVKSLVYRVNKPWLHIDFVYSLLGYRKELDEILKPVHKFTKTIIDKRREGFVQRKIEPLKEEEFNDNDSIYMGTKKKCSAMMDTLLQAQSQGLIDEEGIIEETDTFTFAAYESTSAAMAFTLLLLAHNPDIQEKLFEEIENVTYGKDDLNVDDFNKMTLMDRVLKESFRIYPPVPFIARKLTEDIDYEGIVLRKGTTAEIYIYDIHRDPEVFPDPEKFDPDRFLPENCKNHSKFSFLAFSAGKRNCIGQRFAMLEFKVMLTKIIKNFKIHPFTKREELTFITDLILRTNHSIKMKFEERK